MNTLTKPQISVFGHSTGIMQMDHTFVFANVFPIKKNIKIISWRKLMLTSFITHQIRGMLNTLTFYDSNKI